jgi:hypothetical protein
MRDDMCEDNSVPVRQLGDPPEHCRLKSVANAAELGLLSTIDNPRQDNEFLIDTGFCGAL